MADIALRHITALIARFSRGIAARSFGDERRPVLPLDLDGDVARQLQAAVDLIDFRQHETSAYAAAAAHGRGEANC